MHLKKRLASSWFAQLQDAIRYEFEKMESEFGKRTNGKVSIVIGKAFNKNDIDQFKDDADGLMKFLRTETYKLSPDKNKNYDVGFDFET